MNAASDPEHPARLRAARKVAQWHLGDPYWADRIIGAYINPEAGLDRLREEKAAE